MSEREEKAEERTLEESPDGKDGIETMATPTWPRRLRSMRMPPPQHPQWWRTRNGTPMMERSTMRQKRAMRSRTTPLKRIS